MTYAAVASLSETIKIILNYHEQSISPFFKTQITYLQEHVIFLRSFLEDSPDEARVWEDRMREATIEAEDIIELLLSTVGSSDPKLKSAKDELPDYYDELERVTKKIEFIVDGVKGHTKDVGGVDDGLTEIIDQIRGGSSALESIPIVGIGGIGKTTLARLAYNHRSIVKHFRIRGWVTVSQNYSWRGIILGLLHSMNQLTTERMNLRDEELFRILFNHLLGKKYLIVLDDLWSAEVWDWLKDHIPFDFNGSRILITSRLSDVACCVGFYGRVHEMCLWNEDQIWNLLRQKIFEGDPCPAKLEWIGKMIAGSCIGVPLAIEVVSGILAANLTPAEWEDIAEDMKRQTSIDCEDDEHLLQIIHLSYIYLPHHLRPCFLYLGMFPEDHEIRVSKLVKLWEAEGFLNEDGSQTGEEHLEDLARRSLLSVTKKKRNGKVKSFCIHDLVREMCIRQAHADNFFLHVEGFRVAVSEARRLQCLVSVVDYDDNLLKNVCHSTIRTVICLEGILGIEGMQCWLSYPRLLRILDFSKAYYHHFSDLNDIADGAFEFSNLYNISDKVMEDFDLRNIWTFHIFERPNLSNIHHQVFEHSNLSNIPDQVFEHFHLRYLAFNYPCRIPKAILSLENLQTLVIGSKNQWSIIELPLEIWRMTLLKHLVVHYCKLPDEEEAMLFSQENLETLTEALDFHICLEETLGMIPNLKKLGISWRDESEFVLDNLIRLQKLEILKIRRFKNHCLQWQSIGPLFFPPTLKKLSLGGLSLPWEVMRIVGSLPNLQVLKLRNKACIGGTWETNEGEFSQLTFLQIEESNLKHWITKSSHFPRLKCLVLHGCRSLDEIPNDLGATLESIELGPYSNSSLVDSAKQIKKNLGNRSLQLRCVRVQDRIIELSASQTLINFSKSRTK